MLILLILFINRVIYGLRIKLSEEVILRRPIRTSAIEAGLRNLLEEGEHFGLSQFLKLKRIDISKIYENAIEEEQVPYLVHVFNFYNEGFMTKDDAKMILPAKLVSKYSLMPELSDNEIVKLPENPLSSEFFVASNLNENSLITALQRGLTEKDPFMIWTTWPMETPLHYRTIWTQPEIWRILLIETFCDSEIEIKKNFLEILKTAINKLQFPSQMATNELLMLNISLFSFHLEILRMREHFRYSRKEQVVKFVVALEELEKESLQIFSIIKTNLERRNLDFFKGLDSNSAEILHKSDENLLKNSFYYENRIELFVSILKRLKEQVPNVFADWFCNLFCSFVDIVPIMSLELLLDGWKQFLYFNPSIEAICSLLSWFEGRIKEEYRFKLAQEIPGILLLPYYQKCLTKHIPDPVNLIPYEIRESEYLKKSRGGTSETFTYGLEEFWKPKQRPIIKLLKVFELINKNSLDLYETIDTFFILEPESDPIGLSKFLELILDLFLSIEEWYFLLKETEEIKEIIPSPLFPPKFIPIFVQIIVRCRHLSCKSPFKISEKYLKMAFNTDFKGFYKPRISKFVRSQLKYLTNSCGNRLPKLTKYYQAYFIENFRIQEPENDENFFRDYYNLHQSIKTLWIHAESPQNWDLTPAQLEEVERSLNEVISMNMELFSFELHKQIGPVTFSGTEMSKFLFN